MSYTAVQGQPIQVNLVNNSKDTGWTFLPPNTAVHESCNTGNMRLLNYNFTTGVQYKITYQVVSISGGLVRFVVGGVNGVNNTTSGFKSETITAGSNGTIGSFYSNANCTIKNFNIQPVIGVLDNSARNTPVWSEKIKKWSDFRSLVFDCGYSIFTKNVVFSDGAVYKMQNASTSRNNFFGTQYLSKIKFVEAKQPLSVKTFESISYQANQLLVTTTNGITTSLGQVSELIDTDFLKDTLIAGVTQVSVFSKEGVYSACFLRDGNEDLINGSPLKGNYATVELNTIMSNANQPLQLFSVQIITALSKIGAR